MWLTKQVNVAFLPTFTVRFWRGDRKAGSTPSAEKKEYFFHIFFSMFDGYFERRFKQQFFSASPLRAAATVRRGTVSSQRRQP